MCLEITESALMHEPDLARRHLHELAEVRSSCRSTTTVSARRRWLTSSPFRYMPLPVHELKIDRAFADGLDTDARNAAIARSTILLCRELGLSIIGEGAETPAEQAWLQDNACDQRQGCVVVRPMPLDEFLAWTTTRDGIRA